MSREADPSLSCAGLQKHTMPSSREDLDSMTHGRPQFTTTHWSVIARAGHSDSPQVQAALAEFCQTYWSGSAQAPDDFVAGQPVQPLTHPLDLLRQDQIRRDFSQRREHETAEMRSGVR